MLELADPEGIDSLSALRALPVHAIAPTVRDAGVAGEKDLDGQPEGGGEVDVGTVERTCLLRV